jgi:hypothetical protein
MRVLKIMFALIAAMNARLPGTTLLHGAQIGIDAVHGVDATVNLATGSALSDFRATIISQGNTIVPLTSFDAANLAGLDGVIVLIPYSQNAANYTASQMSALQAFAHRAVFTSDESMWTNNGAGSDRPITFGDNRQLLMNSVSFISAKGILAIGDDGSGFQVANFNALVAPFGITYSANPTDPNGRTVTGFVAHPVTAGISTLGVDFQLPMTVNSPAVDLTIGSGQDNILAAMPVPEPATLALTILGFVGFAAHIRRRPKSVAGRA